MDPSGADRAALGETMPADAFGRGVPRPAPTPPPAGEAPETSFPRDRLEGRFAAAGLRLPGEVGPRLRSTGLLGVGATGRVYSVYDADLERKIAVKVLSEDALAAEDAVAAFVAEARLTASMTHPNVLPVYEIDITGRGAPYFSMPEVSGRTLGDAIAASSPKARDAAIATANQVVNAIIAVGQAAAFAHHRGVVHQDIKPENILLGDFGEVLLLDWGSASRYPATRIYGTPLYMSPEQARRESVTPVSDVYCLGATLFHALLLRVPTWNDDADGFWRDKREGRITPPTAEERAAVSPALLAIALKALAADPTQRYPSMAAMVADLQRYQAGLAVSAYPTPPWLALLGWYRRQRAAILSALVSLVVVIAALAAWWHEKLKERSDWSVIYQDAFATAGMDEVARDWSARTRSWSEPSFHEVASGDAARWHLDRGRLVVVPDDGPCDVAFRPRIRGDIRVEWDYTPLTRDLNLNCFLGADDRFTGYTFHIGGWLRPSNMVMTRGASQDPLQQREVPGLLQVGKTCRFVLEREGNHVSLTVDGQRILEHVEEDELLTPAGQGFGFDACAECAVAISHVRVWHRPLPERISPLAVGNQLYQFGHYADAARIFTEIVHSYRGSELEAAGLYGLGMSELAAGSPDRCRAALRDLTTRFPAARQVPLALRTRIRLALEAGDEAEAAQADEAFAAFPAHPLIDSAFRERAAARLRKLDGGVDFLGVARPPADAVAVIAAVEKELREWCTRHGHPYGRQAFSERACAILADLGENERILELYPEDAERCEDALLRMGRYDDCEHRYGSDRRVRYELALRRGQPQRALAEAANVAERSQAFIDLGDPHALARTDPTDRFWQCRALLMCGRVDEALADYADVDAWRATALLWAGRPEEALQADLRHTPQVEVDALRALGRFDEALQACKRIPPEVRENSAWQVLLSELADGRLVHPDLLTQLSTCGDRFTTGICSIGRAFVPAFLAKDAGARGDLQRRLDSLLAHRYVLEQRDWYTASFVCDQVGEPEYRAQPEQRGIDSSLRFARALRADLRGEDEQALALWRELCAAPATGGNERLIERWRIRVLSAPR